MITQVADDGTIYTFNGIHGVLQQSKPEQQVQISRFPGVRGATVFVGENNETSVWTSYYIRGFSTRELLKAKLIEINRQTTRLSGTAKFYNPLGTVLLATFPKLTFLGFEPGPIRWDGSGANGFHVSGRLLWISRDPVS